MSEERKFPLIFWEETEEFKKLLIEAEEEKEKLVKRWRQEWDGNSYVSPIWESKMAEDGKLAFWINDYGPYNTGRWDKIIRKWPPEEAIKNALRYGCSGLWTVTDLEQLITAGKGPLLVEAMKNCGFRPHKYIHNRWVRITKKELKKERLMKQKEQIKNQNEWKRKYEEEERRKWPPVFGKELTRLKQLWIFLNEDDGLNRTFSIQVNDNNLIFIYLKIHPFSLLGKAEGLIRLDEMLRDKGHIARKQNSFFIEPKNITLENEKCVYIKAIIDNNSYVECVWPHLITRKKIYDLAKDLISRVSRAKNRRVRKFL